MKLNKLTPENIKDVLLRKAKSLFINAPKLILCFLLLANLGCKKFLEEKDPSNLSP